MSCVKSNDRPPFPTYHRQVLHSEFDNLSSLYVEVDSHLFRQVKIQASKKRSPFASEGTKGLHVSFYPNL